MQFRNISLLFLILIISSANAQEEKLFINEWLTCGPININLPAFRESEEEAMKDILQFDLISFNSLKPIEGNEVTWRYKKFKWEKLTSFDGNIKLPAVEDKTAQLFYMGTYLNTQRWIKGKIEISSCQQFRVFLNGKEILVNNDYAEGDSAFCKPQVKSSEFYLEKGKHLLVIKTLKGSDKNDWMIKTTFELDTLFSKNELSLTTDPLKFTTIENLLEDPKINKVSISHDGKYAGVEISQMQNNSGEKINWIEIYNTSDGSLLRSFKSIPEISSITWLPQSNKFTYLLKSKNKSTIWLYDLDRGTTDKLFNEDNLGNYSWSPDGSYLIYSVIEENTGNNNGFIKLNNPSERLPGSKNVSSLYLYKYPEGVKIKLTAGDSTITLNSISHDGKKVLISKSSIDLTTRPYSYTTYFIMDVFSFKVDSLFSSYWTSSAEFSPDGNEILVLGGPSSFGNTGINLPDSLIPNDFDKQAYIYDISSKKVEAITKFFNPSVISAFWGNDNIIYFNTVDRTYQNLYKYNISSRKFTKINLKAEVIESISFAVNSQTAVYRGSSATIPEKAYYLNLKNEKSKIIFDPDKELFANIKLDKTSEWKFTNADGREIDGLIYFPPDFDENKKYPLIVYYYGGTTPVEQSFEGRYPKNIWAANGYIVYVLQPSGAIGYGQDFSAMHVNDWGNRTAQEVINGTKKFLDEHPFIDPEKVGCIGASYGGFMTMNILTKTKIFTAAVSHAGISSLAGYWGEGYWGYTYSAVAGANSFPWNRKDIYIDSSPLFNADKISTPILLLHGASDTNVPVGESIQMFTALKLLGKKVDFIQVTEQDHHILDYKKRMKWSKTIIAWFDKYLKDQPEWYNYLYSEND